MLYSWAVWYASNESSDKGEKLGVFKVLQNKDSEAILQVRIFYFSCKILASWHKKSNRLKRISTFGVTNVQCYLEIFKWILLYICTFIFVCMFAGESFNSSHHIFKGDVMIPKW